MNARHRSTVHFQVLDRLSLLETLPHYLEKPRGVGQATMLFNIYISWGRQTHRPQQFDLRSSRFCF